MVQSEPPDNTVTTPPLPRRAALYACAPESAVRAQQEAELRRYADAYGFSIGVVYSDTGDRSARERLVTEAQADLFDAVLITDRVCLASEDHDYDHIRDALTEVSVRLIVTSEEDQL